MNNQILRILVLMIIAFGCTNPQKSKLDKSSPDSLNSKTSDLMFQRIFIELKLKDSLLFELGFNQCDTNQIKTAISDDFEFYHDQAGIIGSKESFVQSILELCDLNYKPSRELDENSLELHILKNNGEVYGAIQIGKHNFYGEVSNKAKYITSTANFIHLWILEGDDWKLKRVFSYNHQEPEKELND